MNLRFLSVTYLFTSSTSKCLGVFGVLEFWIWVLCEGRNRKVVMVITLWGKYFVLIYTKRSTVYCSQYRRKERFDFRTTVCWCVKLFKNLRLFKMFLNFMYLLFDT